MKIIDIGLILTFALAASPDATVAQENYSSMAPLALYLMPRDVEMALARGAAPDSVSSQAEVLVLTPTGFQTAAKGTNGFVCLVARSWSAGFDDPDFWNPRLQAHYRAMKMTLPGVSVTNTDVLLLPGLENSCQLSASAGPGRSANYQNCFGRPPMTLGLSVLKHLRLYFATHEHVLYVTAADATHKNASVNDTKRAI